MMSSQRSLKVRTAGAFGFLGVFDGFRRRGNAAANDVEPRHASIADEAVSEPRGVHDFAAGIAAEHAA